MFKKFRLKSPAKINLLLKITGVRKDGYHIIATLFQMVELADTLTFSPEPSGKVRVICKGLRIPEKQNLVYRAAMQLWTPECQGVRIEIKKEIPNGAGLGGGSSNAATALMALNRIWKRGFNNAKLRALGAKLGADVPFFLFSPRAWATGIGDKLTRLPPAAGFHILLIKPRLKLSTKMVYGEFDAQLTAPLKSFKLNPSLKKDGILLEDTVRFIENDLEKTVLSKFPVIGIIKREMARFGGKGVCLTGSGSAVYALFDNPSDARKACRAVSARPWWCRVTRPRTDMQHAAGLLGG